MGIELLLLRQCFEVRLDTQWHHRWWRVRVELRDVHPSSRNSWQESEQSQSVLALPSVWFYIMNLAPRKKRGSRPVRTSLAPASLGIENQYTQLFNFFKIEY